jgi:hypothetical protein
LVEALHWQRRGEAVLQRLPATQSPSLAQTKRHTPVALLQVDAPHRADGLAVHDG